MKLNLLNCPNVPLKCHYKVEESEEICEGVNMKISEALVAAQINTFTEAFEKIQRIESAKTQNFLDKKKRSPSSSFEPGD